jgi:hypothetical protein
LTFGRQLFNQLSQIAIQAISEEQNNKSSKPENKEEVGG